MPFGTVTYFSISGRLERVTGPGLDTTYGVKYVRHDNSELVRKRQRVRFPYTRGVNHNCSTL